MIIIGDEAGDDDDVDVDGRQQMVIKDSDEAGGGGRFIATQHKMQKNFRLPLFLESALTNFYLFDSFWG